jgi:pimeloyl-ACP methyl ester carboxylesterase
MAAIVVRLLGVLLLLSALALPLMQAPDRAVETLVGRWAPPPSELIDLGGQLVHFRDEGPKSDPNPIVLLHGLSASLHTWEPWAKALRGQRRVISIDLPGAGLTGPYTGARAGQPYTLENDSRFVLDVLKHLGVQRFVVVGNSLGGAIAWHLAQAEPQRVTQLVLVDALAYPLSLDGMPLAWRLTRLPVLGATSEYLLPRPLVLQGLRSAYANPAQITEALVDRYYELALRTGNRVALRQRLRAYDPDTGPAHLTGISTPTLVLWGARDQLIPVSHARRLAADIPGARLVVWDDLGHVPQEEDPARSVAAFKAFLLP